MGENTLYLLLFGLLTKDGRSDYWFLVSLEKSVNSKLTTVRAQAVSCVGHFNGTRFSCRFYSEIEKAGKVEAY